jgi:hypothetical protein
MEVTLQWCRQWAGGKRRRALIQYEAHKGRKGHEEFQGAASIVI